MTRYGTELTKPWYSRSMSTSAGCSDRVGSDRAGKAVGGDRPRPLASTAAAASQGMVDPYNLIKTNEISIYLISSCRDGS